MHEFRRQILGPCKVASQLLTITLSSNVTTLRYQIIKGAHTGKPAISFDLYMIGNVSSVAFETFDSN